MLKWFKNLFGYVMHITTSSIRCTTIYTTEKNFIILVQYGSDQFYEVIEFVNCANRAGLHVILAHDADISNRTEMLPTDEGLELKVPAKIANHRYYMLISGEPEQYSHIAKYLSLSNPIYSAILMEAYQHLSSTAFDDLIKDNVLNEDSFKYIRVRPPYDDLVMVTNPINDTGVTYYDNADFILSKLPDCFDAIDIARVIHIYNSSTRWNMKAVYVGEYSTASELAAKLFSYKNGETNANEYTSLIMNIRLLKPLYARLVPEFAPTDASTDCLAILSYPIYFREANDSAGTDDDGRDAAGALDPRQVDDLFNQQYDRFTLPTADSLDDYKPLDEVVSTTNLEPVNPSPQEHN